MENGRGERRRNVFTAPSTNAAPGKLARSQACPCNQWKFSGYHPSALETRWASGAVTYQHDVCAQARLEAEGMRRWLDYGTHAPGLASPPCAYTFSVGTWQLLDSLRVRQLQRGPSDAVSSMAHVCACNQSVEYHVPIEPLVGTLRHPNTCTGRHDVFPDRGREFDRFVKRTDHVIVDPFAAGAGAQSGRVLLFDVSAPDSRAGTAGGRAALVNLFGGRCTPVQAMWVWSTVAADSADDDVQMQLVRPLRPAVHFVSGADAAPGDEEWVSPLTHIRTEASVHDLVILRLDIADEAVEAAVVSELLGDPHLMGLVDEMFWSHRADFVPMSSPGAPWAGSQNMYTQALEMFGKLRHGGVRVHPWV